MKILGLHWAGHAVYLLAISCVWYYGIHTTAQVAGIKTEIGQVQKISLPLVHRINELSFLNIQKHTEALPIPENEKYRRAARRAMDLVAVFSKKCHIKRNSLFPVSGQTPNDFSGGLQAEDYYRLGDSLKTILPPNAALDAWLDRCLFADYRACPPGQLAGWLATRDEDELGVVLQNLNLKAELALHTGLSALEKQVKTDVIVYDALLPVMAYTDCPRVGRPFEADVFLSAYSLRALNLKAKVNGRDVPIEKGLVHYETISGASGAPKLRVEFILTNPFTGVRNSYTKER